MESKPLYEINEVSKDYLMGEVIVPAVQKVTFDIPMGKIIAIVGPSGSGKSTILNLLGGMDTPTSGKLVFHGRDISTYCEKKLTYFRRKHIGFVFQFYNLMPNLTAKENVELATAISPNPLTTVEVLGQVGLKGKEARFPSQLSGGEQQRVAIARAIAKNPSVLLCDEPTGALDFSTGISILRLLKDINRNTQKTVVIITHNQPIEMIAHRVIKMRSGNIVDIIDNSNPVEPETIAW